MSRQNVPALVQSYQILVADYNGDGKLDLATPTGIGFFAILNGAGDGTFSVATQIGAINPIQDAAVFPLHGQKGLHKLDLVESGGAYFGAILNTTK